jgi:hypothetical protein
VFQAFIDLGDGGGTNDTEGLFLFDDVRGLVPVARLGDVVPDAAGVAVGGIDFTGGTSAHGAGTTGLNAKGEVAYRMAGSDGNYYVVVAPEPSDPDLEAVALASLLFVRIRGRARATTAPIPCTAASRATARTRRRPRSGRPS